MADTAHPQGGTDKTAQNAGFSSARQDSEDEINLVDYLRVVSKHKRLIFRIFVVTVIATAVISLLLPKMFSATASVVPPVDILQKESALTTGLGGVTSDLLRKAMDVTSIADMYVGILKSRSIADALVERFDLPAVYRARDDISKVRQILQDRTSIEVTEEGIVTVTVEDRDPCRAADLANAYVEELDRQNKKLFVGQASSKRMFLENRLREIEQELSKIDNLLSREAKIKEMLFELLTREYEIAKIEEAKSMPTIQILDRAVVPEKKNRPKRGRMVLFGGCAGLFVGLFAAFGRECWARSKTDILSQA